MQQDDECTLSPRYQRLPRRADTRERRRQERQLADALAQGGLCLSWTSRVHLHDGAVLADEATLHWALGQRAPLPAAAVLASSSDMALGWSMAGWMLRAGCAAALARGSRMVSLLLPQAIEHDGALIAAVDATLAEFGLAAERLELRLSEMSLLQPSTETLLCLSALRDRGVGLAIDDFGMQVASVAMLRQVPLTTLRLDPSLTHDLQFGGEDAAICAAMIAIAHALNMQVVAQAVNRAEQVAPLREAGVDAGVGSAAVDGAEMKQAA